MVGNELIMDCLAKVVKNNPKKTAIICEDEKITYEDFYAKIFQYGEEIVQSGKDRVFIENKRSIDMIARIYGCVKAGCRYRIINEESNFNDDLVKADGVDKILYEIETSGTTGRKKLICREAESFARFIKEDYVGRYGISVEDVILNQLDFSFDAAAKDIFSIAVSGATLVIGNRDKLNYPMEFINTLNKYNVTVFQTTPFFIKNMAKLKAFDEIVPKTLKKVLFVGDVLRSEYLNYWIEHMSQVTFVNQYGVSEFPGNLLDNIIDEPVSSKYVALKNEIVPVKLDDKGQIITVSGIKTGDVTVCCEQGGRELCIVGRMDNIRKIRGYRISLEEIERKMCQDKDIENVICEVIDDEIYALCEVVPAIVLKNTKAMFKNVLPPYCRPVHLKVVDNLPVNANGKPDRKRIIEYF